MMLAFSATTGEPSAILRDEGWLTDMRTGIGGAIATKALASRNAERVLIIGSGIQARFQATCLASLMPEKSFNFLFGAEMKILLRPLWRSFEATI